MRHALLLVLLLFLLGCSKPDTIRYRMSDNSTLSNEIQIKNNEVTNMTPLKITSPSFNNNELIPAKYTCEGLDINPEIDIANIPKEAKTLALIVDDPDAPMGTWDHWIVFNISPSAVIKEDSIPGVEAINSFRKNHYGGPCPPSGTHRYFFKVYALNTSLPLSSKVNKQDMEKAMQGHIIAQGELVGLYRKRS